MDAKTPPLPRVPLAALPSLASEELSRYARHFSLPEVGAEGQQRLKASRVALVGTGGLGSPSALYLAAAGVGTIGLVDSDVVEVSNLQRQVLFGTAAVGTAKVEVASARLKDLNPHVEIEQFETRLTSGNALDILRGFDVVIDGSDNFPTRYLVNDACLLLGKPNVYGSIFRFDGQASVFCMPDGPCYRCLFREPPPPNLVPSCAEAGVLGVLPGIIGSIQALEAIKLIVGAGTPLIGRLVMFEALAMTFREITLRRDPDCSACGEHTTLTELVDYDAFCGEPAPSASGYVAAENPEITVHEVAERRQHGDGLVIVDVREPYEWQICAIEDALQIPLRELPGRTAELDPEQLIVTYCHTGMRSLHALQLLSAAGFSNVRSMRGGIDAWAREIDVEMGRY